MGNFRWSRPLGVASEIVVTTQQDQAAQDAAYAAGVSAILPKPFTVEQLDAVLQRFV